MKLMQEIEKQNLTVQRTLKQVSVVQHRVALEASALEEECTDLCASKQDLTKENQQLEQQLKETQKAYYVLYNLSQSARKPSPSPLKSSSPNNRGSSQGRPGKEVCLRDFDF